MSWYPQFGAGAIAQFPIGRTRKLRTMTNWMENDERVVLEDAASREIAWNLSYQDLSDDEVSRLEGLFQASNGGFGAFGFIDPMANLLGSSGDLTQPDWTTGLLNTGAGAPDPIGGNTAWNLVNSTPAEQSLQQTLGVPAEYVACFSVWVWSNSGSTVTLARGGVRKAITTGPRWARHFVSGSEPTGTGPAVFSVGVPAGATVRIWGPQAEAQPYPSQYKPTGPAKGIYEETYFSNDELKITFTAPGISSCDVTLISRG